MKKLIIGITVVLALFTAQAQTNTNSPVIGGPAADAWKFVTTEGITNWVVAPYVIYDSHSEEFGGGLGVGYMLSQFVVPTLRVDYLHKEVWMPSASLQLQLPVRIMNKVTFTPFAFGGIATCVSGQGSENGTAVGIYGIGGALTLKKDKWYLLGDAEQWNGANFQGWQYRFGFAYKF